MLYDCREAIVEYVSLGSPVVFTNIDSIVFVHGLTGNRLTTWTHNGNQEPWPELLLKDDIPNARILTFGYDANVVNWLSAASQNRIREHANNLNATLSDLRDETETVSTIRVRKFSKYT